MAKSQRRSNAPRGKASPPSPAAPQGGKSPARPKSAKPAPRVRAADQARPGGDAAGATPRAYVKMTATHDEIAHKAYEIWLAKGRPPGQADQNWREAEAALTDAVSHG